MGFTKLLFVGGLCLSTIAKICAASPVSVVERKHPSASDRFDDWDQDLMGSVIRFFGCLAVILLVVLCLIICVFLSSLPLVYFTWAYRSAFKRSVKIKAANESDETKPLRYVESYASYGCMADEASQSMAPSRPPSHVSYSWNERCRSCMENLGIAAQTPALSDIIEEIEPFGDEDWKSLADPANEGDDDWKSVADLENEGDEVAAEDNADIERGDGRENSWQTSPPDSIVNGHAGVIW